MARHSRNPIKNRIRGIRKSLAAIDRSLQRLIALTNGARRGRSSATARRKRRLNLSPRRLAALRLQGSYIGYLRLLKPRQKAKVKALRLKRGYGPAIALAKRLGKR